jgi:hypothetical protein
MSKKYQENVAGTLTNDMSGWYRNDVITDDGPAP